MKKQYIIIYEKSFDKLEDRVSEAMENGYKPHGSLVFRPAICGGQSGQVLENQNSAFIQAMVLKN